jgi:hypothetical protein
MIDSEIIESYVSEVWEKNNQKKGGEAKKGKEKVNT